MNKKILVYIYSIIIIFFVFAIVPKNIQNDTFFSIVCGKNYFINGITNEESLVWHNGLEFTNSRWLFDIIICKIYELANFTGIYFFILIFAVINALIYYLILNKYSNRSFISFILTILIMYAARGEFTARAQIISFLLFTIEFYLLDNLFNSGKRRYMIFLIITGYLLSIIHASVFPMYFVLYLPYLGESILYFLKNKILQIQNESNKYEIKKGYIIEILITIIISFILGFCTPNGITVYTDLIKVMHGSSSSYISELQSLSLLDLPCITFLIMISIGLIAFTKTKVKISDILFILGFFVMTLVANRAQYYFYFISSICIFRILFDSFKEYDLKINFKGKKVVVILILFTIMLNSYAAIKANKDSNFIDIEKYPVAAVAWMKENLDIDNMKIFNGMNIGSYLEFSGIKAFYDSRTGIFTTEFNKGCTILDDGLGIENTTTYYGVIFEKYKITHVLISKKSSLYDFLVYDDSFEVLYQDSNFILFKNLNVY